MKWRITILILFVTCSLSTQILACYGGRAIGMGGAFTSIADGTLAIYWNQAGLAFTDIKAPTATEISYTYTSPEGGINYNNTFSAGMLRYGRLAFGYGETQLADWAGGELWRTFALGLRMTEHLAVGGSIREVSSAYDVSTGYDLSLQYRQGIYRFGLLYQDINGGSAQNPYLANFRPSVGLETDRLTMAIDIYMANNLDNVFSGEKGYYNHQTGIEYRPFGRDGFLALRGGFYHGAIVAGVGLKFNEVFADTVWIPEQEVIQTSIGLRF